ncbi:MAG: DUF2764 family protein [Tenuifilum sp.]|uniref:DUF2764 family protein n=1 Tax=Tenuifilum sp. TaxID=2760880 RepID=UPI001B53E22F|nr:DUF2764 family protein [Bacteroidales bacterium]HOK60329.1 DUF2764 family protein [Tenuifilum sp.]MBP9029121.1 DUF2764 family protein [Bacteroidales bacterium]HOK85229.1 DUF2764 family protein [Tenuifilum sp.]HON69605.1 DUF2764 family protein [Tenuifilum sp.]
MEVSRMMRNYYYLVAGLPELIMDQDRKDFSVNALKQEVKEQVSSSDYRLVEFLHLPYDNDNFLNKLLNRGLEFNDLGSYEKFVFDELDENINQLPQYMQDFYYRFTGKQRSADDAVDQDEQPKDIFEVEKLPEIRFLESFYDLALSQNNDFIRYWFSFTRDFNNVLTALNCRRLGVDPATQLVGNNWLTEVLVKSQAADFGLKREVDYIDRLIQATDISDVLERERKLDLIKWDMSVEFTTWDYFNINFILGFFVRAGIVHRWLKLDAKTGEELFRKLFDDLKSSYNLSEKF